MVFTPCETNINNTSSPASLTTEKCGTSRGEQQASQVRLSGVAGNTPATHTAVSNGAALASVSVNVMLRKGTLLPSSSQAVAITTPHAQRMHAHLEQSKETGMF